MSDAKSFLEEAATVTGTLPNGSEIEVEEVREKQFDELNAKLENFDTDEDDVENLNPDQLKVVRDFCREVVVDPNLEEVNMPLSKVGILFDTVMNALNDTEQFEEAYSEMDLGGNRE